MIDGKTILGVIPARGGSKGVPGKNVRRVAGKPLLAWTIEEARRSRYLDRFILTSDDDQAIEVAREWGCEVPFKRPESLAQDHSLAIDYMLHTMEMMPKHDYLVLLQPTSPLRSAEDIDNCLERCIRGGYQSAVSVVEPDKSPYWMYHLSSNHQMTPLLPDASIDTRRQDLPPVFVLNGALYVSQWDWLLNGHTFVDRDTLAYVMPKERSLDIDTELDFKVLRALLEENCHVSVKSSN